MSAVVIGGIIVVAIICTIVDEGGFLAKFAFGALVAALAFVLLRWITGWELMTTLAKLSAAGTILTTLLGIILKIAG